MAEARIVARARSDRPTEQGRYSATYAKRVVSVEFRVVACGSHDEKSTTSPGSAETLIAPRLLASSAVKHSTWLPTPAVVEALTSSVGDHAQPTVGGVHGRQGDPHLEMFSVQLGVAVVLVPGKERSPRALPHGHGPT
jgi:hypothetical protein